MLGLKTCPWPKGIATRNIRVPRHRREIKNLSLTQRDCDVVHVRLQSVRGIKNLSLTQRDCDVCCCIALACLYVLKTCPWPKGIATDAMVNVLFGYMIKNLSLTQRDCDLVNRQSWFLLDWLKTCPWPKGIATRFQNFVNCYFQLKTCPWPKGIATRFQNFLNCYFQLKTCPWPKGIATSRIIVDARMAIY